MRRLLTALFFMLSLLAPTAWAAEAPQTAGQVKLELLKQLETDGYLSTKLAAEAKERYVRAEDLSQTTVAGAKAGAAAAEPSLWERYVSWMNFVKLLGVVFLLVAFSGLIGKLARLAWGLITLVPMEVYQAVFLGAGALCVLAPQAVWASQSFYLALFGAFSNLMVTAWVVESHPRLQAALKRLFNLGLPAMSVVSFWAMLYFGALALHYQSQIFGFFAAVSLSGIMTFGMYYRPGVLTLDFSERAMPAVVVGHLLVLAAYAALRITGTLPAASSYFAVGLEYYCTIAMGVGFLVAASPFVSNRATGAYFLLFVLVVAAAVTGYFFFDLKVIGSIVLVFAALLALEWIGYLGYHVGFIFGTFTLGAVLYGSSLLLEHYGQYIVLRLA